MANMGGEKLAKAAEQLKELKTVLKESKSGLKSFVKSVSQGTSKVAKAGSTAVTSGIQAEGKVLANVAKYAKFGKFAKIGGPAIMVAASALSEGPEVFNTYKKLGAGKGTKQLVKSGVTVAAEIGGFVVGMKAGAAIGASIGTVVPGLGNVIGAVAGMVIGGLVGWLAGKLTRKVVGKPELQKHAEQQAAELAKAAKNDDDIKNQLIDATAEKLATADINDKEAQKVQEAFSRITGYKENIIGTATEEGEYVGEAAAQAQQSRQPIQPKAQQVNIQNYESLFAKLNDFSEWCNSGNSSKSAGTATDFSTPSFNGTNFNPMNNFMNPFMFKPNYGFMA